MTYYIAFFVCVAIILAISLYKAIRSARKSSRKISVKGMTFHINIPDATAPLVIHHNRSGHTEIVYNNHIIRGVLDS